MSTEYSGSGDLARSLELLWGTQERPSRGPKPSLDVERIARAGIELADAEGLVAVSMRRVAKELGVGTMSLYRYVPSKSELLDLMLDRVYDGLPDPPEPTGGWRKGMTEIAHGTWEMYHEHIWLLQVSQARPLLGPHAVRSFQYALRVVADTGLSDVEKINLIVLVDGYVVGAARNSIDAAQAAARTGVSDESFWATQEPFLTKMLASGDYPLMTALDPTAFQTAGSQAFEFGLERVLDGIEIFIARKTS